MNSSLHRKPCWLGIGGVSLLASAVLAVAQAPLVLPEVAPIVAAPGTRLRADFLAQHHAWYRRVLIAPLQARAKGQPWEAEALAFAERAVDDFYLLHPRESETLDTLLAEARRLPAAGCDDALVVYLEARLHYRKTEDQPVAERTLGRIFRKHAGEVQLGPALRSFIGRELTAVVGQDNAKADIDGKILRWIEEALHDGTFTPDDGAIFLHHQMTPPWSWFHDRKPEELHAIYERAPFPEWVQRTLRGHVEATLAKAARGTEFAHKVAPEQWRAAAAHFVIARRELTAAWKLRPDQPEAAAKMIPVVTIGGGEDGETERLWFDRAITAQFDFSKAYTDLLWAHRPRWGGSAEEVLAIGKACAETKRYETEVPLHLYKACDDILRDVRDGRTFFRRPEVAAPVVALSQALLTEPTRAAERPRRTSLLAVYAWLCGDFSVAEKTLATIDKLDPDAFAMLDKLDISEARLRGEVALGASPAQRAFDEAKRAYDRGDLEAARAALTQAASKAPPGAQALIASRLAVVGIERALAAGQWVSLVPRPDLLEWTVQKGHWSADAEGDLINKGREDSGFIYHQARIGPELELRAEFTVKGNPENYRACGLGFAFQHGDDKQWILCEVGEREPGSGKAHLLDRYHASGIEGRPVKLRARNQLFVRATGGRVTFECNGQRLYENIEPGKLGAGPADGRVGIGAHKFGRGSETRITKIEVRRLGTP